jgi:hypothetical protein
MAIGDERYIPDITAAKLKTADGEAVEGDSAPLLRSVQEQFKKIWENTHKLEGRLGLISLRDSLSVLGDIAASGGATLADFFKVTTRARTLDSTLSTAPLVSTSSDSILYRDLINTRLMVSESGRAYADAFLYERVRLYNTAAQTLVDATLTAITFDTELYDTASLHSLTLNTSRITIPAAGYYNIGANVQFTANAVGDRLIEIRLNGTTTRPCASRVLTNTVAGQPTNMNLSADYLFAAGDYIELFARQASGGPLDIVLSAHFSPAMWAHRIG